MNNQTEQEFFKCFGIEKKAYKRKYELNFKTVKMPILKYPKITPRIALRLEEIILDDKKHLYSTKLTYFKTPNQKYRCNFNSDKAVGFGTLAVFGYEKKTKIEALLDLCIQLKDEIQNEVKELFQ